ncbi:carbon-nitrogen hydrolase family protein [Pseudescherichia sp.]|uniref:carbon-nitrogen hydrolase family protein n=1 Tax=Pseudescherichia sp. TaxID=2055881 RepID=UPI0028AF38A1|nr:carbon-nitrogen hydrolase family protein [Pseudescherichia sp.]
MGSIQGKLKIAAAQFAPVRGCIEENMRYHELLIASAASAGVNLIFFPELSLTGYEPEMAEQLALADESCLRPLQRLAEKQDMVIIAGAPLNVKGRKPAIGACVISSKQPISYYRKMYLHPGESDYFSAGEEECVFTARTFNVGVAICADAGQPMHAERTVHMGADIYLNSVLSAGGYDKDASLLQSYAKRYAMPTLMANYCGPSGGWKPVGKSAAWNEKGERIAQAPEDRAALVIMDLQDGKCSGQVICLSK